MSVQEIVSDATQMAETRMDSTVEHVALQISAPDLEVVLEAWSSATNRLQQTHLTLCEEVRRLSDELEIKNQELARNNRLADLSRMASCVAHEVRNCLTPINLYMSLLRRRIPVEANVRDVLDKPETDSTHWR